MRYVYNILVGTSERKRPFGRLRRRWEYSIKVDNKEIQCEGVALVKLTQDKDK
jgi:hypothetical protein